MKLAKKVLEKINYNYEAGDTSPSEEDGHFHKTSMDFSGNGKTIKTLPNAHEDHGHEIKGGKVLDSGNGHTHEIGA